MERHHSQFFGFGTNPSKAESSKLRQQSIQQVWTTYVIAEELNCCFSQLPTSLSASRAIPSSSTRSMRGPGAVLVFRLNCP